MFPNNFKTIPVFSQRDPEQMKPRSQIQNPSNLDLQDQSFNNVPNLGANFDISNSIDFCAKNSMQYSIYNQWEVDADDFEERRILDNLQENLRSQNHEMYEEKDFWHQKEKLGQKFAFKGTVQAKQHPFRQSEQMEVQRPTFEHEGLIRQETRENFHERYDENVSVERPTLQKRDLGGTNKLTTQKEASVGLKTERITTNPNYSFNKTIDSEVIQVQFIEKETSPLQKFAFFAHKGDEKNENINLNKQSPAISQFQPNPTQENKPTPTPKKIDTNQIQTQSEPEDLENIESPYELRQSGMIFLKQRVHEKIKASSQVNFNVLVVGASGLGKSTFIDAFLNNRYHVTPIINSLTEEIVEKSGTRTFREIKFKINLIDTPGYGLQKDPKKWYASIKQYIQSKFIDYKSNKTRMKNKKKQEPIEDKRVHAILFFFSGPRISDEDINYMKKFQKYGSIIPVLAKGDSYSKEEILETKRLFTQKINAKGVEFFNFQDALQDDPRKLQELMNGNFGHCPPFVMISSLKKIEISPGKFIYGREFPWGVCNIENQEHSDFLLLRTLLGGHICQEAIEQTNYYYKRFLTRQKEKQKLKKDDNNKKFGFGAVVVMGLAGIYYAASKKLMR